MASISALGVGSGLDLTGLLDQLRSAERQKLQPIVTQKNQEQAKISAFGRLQSGLDKFQAAVAKLNDAALYSSLSTSVRGEGVTATASDQASAGRYEVSVTQAARAGTLATQRVASTTDEIATAGGTLELTFAGLDENDEPRTVGIEIAAGSSLAQIRDAINAHEDAGVTASIINDGSGYRLALSSTETGADAAIESTNFSSLVAGNLAPQAGEEITQEGRDALLNINGVTITSASNRVEGAIQGITLELDSAAEGKTSTIVVERDSGALKEAVQGFVSAYNEMKSTIGRMTNVTGDADTAGELVGDRTVRTIESRLSRDLANSVPGGDLTIMADLGITLRANGRLELDESKLDEVIANNAQGLADFFAGEEKEGGMAGRLDATLGQILGNEGLIKSSIEGSENRVRSLETRFERMELTIERTVERYRRQFSQLDGLIAQMNATSSYLTQQLDMLGNMNQPRR